jgi:protein translocase SEC61 complex gamma subunit
LPLRGILDSTSRLLKLVKRPTRDDFTTSIKITLIGVGLLGVIGFIVKFMGTILLAARPTA